MSTFIEETDIQIRNARNLIDLVKVADISAADKDRIGNRAVRILEDLINLRDALLSIPQDTDPPPEEIERVRAYAKELRFLWDETRTLMEGDGGAATPAPSPSPPPDPKPKPRASNAGAWIVGGLVVAGIAGAGYMLYRSMR